MIVAQQCGTRIVYIVRSERKTVCGLTIHEFDEELWGIYDADIVRVPIDGWCPKCKTPIFEDVIRNMKITLAR
jgi:hypothetical protein